MKQVVCPCIIDTEFLNFTCSRLDFAAKTFIFGNFEEKPTSHTPLPEPSWDNYSLQKSQKAELISLLNWFRNMFYEELGLTHYSINTRDASPVKAWPYRCDRAKTQIVEYIQKILKLDIIMACDFHNASPVVLCRKKNGKSADDHEAWRFTVDYESYMLRLNFPYIPFHIYRSPPPPTSKMLHLSDHRELSL